jgi:dipeptidyl aminopeptidase/acylaminoacyl peptidase
MSAGVIAVLGMASFAMAGPAHASYAGPNGANGGNGLIAFVADTDSGAQLFTVRANGHGLRQLTHLEGGVSAPDWSPDGRWILYEYDLPDDQGSSLEVVRADGSHRRTLAEEPGVSLGAASYTPTGQRIVFARFDPAANVSGIWSLELSGGQRHEITAQSGPGMAAPKVSPNGHTLSFMISEETTGNGLYACALSHCHPHEVVPEDRDLVDKNDWSADGRLLASSDGHDHFEPGVSENIFTIRSDGRSQRYLTHFTGGDLNAVMGSYSPDGQWIAYRFESHGQFGLYIMDRSGHRRQPVLALSDLKPRYIDWGQLSRAAA